MELKEEVLRPFGRGYKASSKEKIENALERIRALPTKTIRGLELPYDSSGYYICYTNADYYVKRRWREDHEHKYYSPYGHVKPMFMCGDITQDTLILVEGQINALSVELAFKDALNLPLKIVSPGAATDFNKPKNVSYYLRFNRICIIVDKDAAGIAAAVQLRDELLKHGKRVTVYPMKKDLNDVLVAHGVNKVREEVTKALEM